jgi:hypothetical protein
MDPPTAQTGRGRHLRRATARLKRDVQLDRRLEFAHLLSGCITPRSELVARSAQPMGFFSLTR